MVLGMSARDLTVSTSFPLLSSFDLNKGTGVDSNLLMSEVSDKKTFHYQSISSFKSAVYEIN